MATPLPFLTLPLTTHVPVTPPPERQGFPQSAPLLSPNFVKSCSAEAYRLAAAAAAAAARPQGTAPSSRGVVGGISQATTTATATTSTNTMSPGKPLASASSVAGASAALDPQQLATVSRIAAYYQQQYQAMANHQHQQCQAWANMHRQRCQGMLGAAALVITWYLRDRAVRRRKKRGRRFQRALLERCSGNGGGGVGGVGGVGVSAGRVKKGDAVRKWVAAVPDRFVSPTSPVRDDFADADEAKFDIDRAATPDKELEFIQRANDLFKSQLAKVNLPQIGPLSFDESDCSGSEDGGADDADADADLDLDSWEGSEVGAGVEEDQDMEYESEMSEDDDDDDDDGLDDDDEGEGGR